MSDRTLLILMYLCYITGSLSFLAGSLIGIGRIWSD